MVCGHMKNFRSYCVYNLAAERLARGLCKTAATPKGSKVTSVDVLRVASGLECWARGRSPAARAEAVLRPRV